MDHPTYFDKEQDVKDFIWEVYGQALPAHARREDVNVVWVAVDRMKMLRLMQDGAKNEDEYNFLAAMYSEFELMLSGFLYAVEAHSNEVAKLRQQLVEKNAQANRRNIDSYAQAGD